MGKHMGFGWRANLSADGFEQHHGRFTMEVFWSDAERSWSWVIWSGKNLILDVNKSLRLSLEEAKHQVLKEASALERQALQEDKKVM